MQEKRKRRTRSERQLAYAEFLKSDFWQQLRAKQLKHSPACERCQCTTSLQVHHTVYREWYSTQIDDLETLCRRCHLRHHGLQDKKRKRKRREKKRNKRRRFKPRSSLPIKGVLSKPVNLTPRLVKSGTR